MTGIYRIENLINHKNYIGQTTQMNIRWSVHKRLAFEPNAASYNSRSAISSACNNHGTIKNYIWKFQDDNCTGKQIAENLKQIEETRRNNVSFAVLKRCCKSVNQYTPDGKYIQTYSSVAEAGRALGKGHGCIARVCRGEGKISYGYIWRYTSNEFPIGEDL